MSFGKFLISYENYRSIEAVNNGTLSQVARSPAYALYRATSPPEPPTRATRIGIVTHLLAFEPGVFESRYAVVREDGRTRLGKAEREAAAERGAETISGDEFEDAEAMASSIRSHPRAKALFEQATAVEQTAVWEEPLPGYPPKLAKARRDLVGPGWLADLKTTSSLDRFSPFAVTDLGYHRQADWYIRGSRRLGDPIEAFFFLVVANSPPYESAVFIADEESLGVGARENDRLLKIYLDCERSGVWPRHVTDLLVARITPAALFERGT